MSVLTRTDVTAVKLYESFILAGIGSWMNVFDRNSAKLIQRIHVLNGPKIYNFVPSKGTKVLVFGGKQFSIITTSSEVFVQLFEAIVCNDWLHSGVWLSDSRVALLTAHNVVQIWDTTNQSLVTKYISKENSILYSGLLLPLADDILVFSGTVYSEVLIHRCGSNAVLHSLQGHKGVIFSVSCCLSKGVIVTTSDDRSVRIWQLDNTSAFLPNSVDYWENVNITCIHELYGHLARVMRNCIKDDFIVSIGEDSCICFWGYDGILQRKLITHQNACIWSLDADDKDLLTGGGDSGVILHPLTILMEYGTKKVLDIEATNAKRVAFTARRNIVIMTDSNQLVYYVTHDKSPSIFRLQHESTYKLLSISSCKQIVAVVDMEGKLDVFIETCKGPPGIQHLIDTKLEIGKILYMGWAGNRHLVLCSDTGAITVLASKDNGTEKFANFILPPCKERWLTSVAINVKKDLLVVGDRCGSLHIYITGQKNPTQSFKGVHGRYGATSISIHNNSIITTGKDGTVKYFYVDNDCKVKLMSKQIIDFQWVETFIDKERHYICGFQERIFVVYDIRNNNRVFEVPCGGGHRSWDVTRYIDKVGDKYKECIEFVYLKNSNIQLETFEIGKVSSRNIVSGTHSKEINCLKTHVCELDPSLTFIISGGEDTSLRISRLISDIDFRDEVIFRHLSNIRTLKYATMDDNKVLLVSAGGRAQICIKLLQFEKDGDEVKVVTEELSDYLISGTDKDRKGNQSWRNCSVDFDPETRVMDLDIIKVDGKFIIIAGCSDAYLRVFDFKYSGDKAEFKLAQQIKHHNTCILKTHSLKYQDRTLVITCTTRGILTFWNLANMKDSESIQLNPFETLSIHKSGINSLGCKVLDREILVATGGDDNTVHLNLIGIKENLETSVNSTWSSSTLHCSGITGVSVVDDLIVTTSIDQRVTMQRWRIDEGIQCEFVTQVFSDVADIQGLEVLKQDSDTITVCVFGKGLEVISMPRPSL